MATNQVYNHGDQFSVAVTQPASPVSGDPILIGQLPGVALTTEGADGLTTVKTNGVYLLTVEGAPGAIAIGDIVYYDAAGVNAKLNGDNTKVRYGYALGTVAGAAVTIIPVKIGY